MGISGSVKRKRLKSDVIASKVEEEKHQQANLKRILGEHVLDTPFVLDTKGMTKDELAENDAQSSARLLKSIRKQSKVGKSPQVSVRKSEAALRLNENIKPLPTPAIRVRKPLVSRSKVTAEQKKQLRLKKDTVVATHDLWGESESKVSGPKRKFDPTFDVIVKSTDKMYSKQAINGISINPLNKSHQDLIAQAVADEVYIQEKEAITRHRLGLDVYGIVHSAVENDEERNTEESSSSSEDDEKDDEQNENGSAEMFEKRASSQRKTHAQRNKEKRNLDRKRKEAMEKVELKKSKDIDQIGELLSEIQKDESKIKSARKHVPNASASKIARVKGGRRIPRRQVIVPVTSDLAPSYRQTVTLPCASLLKDSFIGLQEAGFIEPSSGKRKHKKSKTRR